MGTQIVSVRCTLHANEFNPIQVHLAKMVLKAELSDKDERFLAGFFFSVSYMKEKKRRAKFLIGCPWKGGLCDPQRSLGSESDFVLNWLCDLRQDACLCVYLLRSTGRGQGELSLWHPQI
jgi:hypothetical protein